MLKFHSLEQFITVLHQNRKLLSNLFEKRNITLRLEDVEQSLEDNTELLEKLIDSNMVALEVGIISLKEGLSDFFEMFLDVRTEINTGVVQDILENIKDNKGYYLAEESSKGRTRYLELVKKYLKKAGVLIIQQVAALREQLDLTYKTEKNLKIKLSKLEKLRAKREVIQTLVDELRRLLSDDVFFKNATDERLSLIINNLKSALRETGKNLLKIQENIILYIVKSQQQSKNFEKLQRLKYLRDQHEIKAKTNIVEILSQEHSLFFDGKIILKTKVSLGFLETDEGNDVIIKANKKRTNKTKIKTKLAQTIPDELLNPSAIHTKPLIDLEALKNTYLIQGGDLFKFIQQYDFGHTVNYNERLTLFCKMVSLFDKLFEISGRTARNDKGTEYAEITLKTTL